MDRLDALRIQLNDYEHRALNAQKLRCHLVAAKWVREAEKVRKEIKKLTGEED